MAYCLIDGKVEQESVFETNLYNELLDQLKQMKAGLRALKFKIHAAQIICIAILLENQNRKSQSEPWH